MYIFKLFLKFIKWSLIVFFCSTITAVIVYRFVPVYITPLMVIRSVSHVGTDKSIFWRHEWKSLDKISKHLPVAVMASEDQRFLLHHGFDFDAIQKAVKHNRSHSVKRGASTISQQTAKNVFLWPGRSWVRKGLETYFTFMIELFWSKQRIMEVYLNSIEMGESIYGAEAVAKEHFSKSADVLTRDECALIAATLPNPLVFDSSQPTDYMLRRRRQIERQMRFMPSFPKAGESYDPSTSQGGIYRQKR